MAINGHIVNVISNHSPKQHSHMPSLRTSQFYFSTTRRMNQRKLKIAYQASLTEMSSYHPVILYGTLSVRLRKPHGKMRPSSLSFHPHIEIDYYLRAYTQKLQISSQLYSRLSREAFGLHQRVVITGTLRTLKSSRHNHRYQISLIRAMIWTRALSLNSRLVKIQ